MTDGVPEKPTIPADRARTGAFQADPRQALTRTLRRIYDLGLTTTSGGNLSVVDSEGTLWITPAGCDKGRLRPDQIIPLERSGRAQRAADGRTSTAPAIRPSSELPFHRAVYAVRPDVRAIVHAHPVSIVAFSLIGQAPDTRVSARWHATCGRVGWAAYARPGSDALGRRIADSFREGADCVVLENHGVVIGGRTLRQAFERLESLDLCARALLHARNLARECPLAEEELALHDRKADPRAPEHIPDRPATDEEASLRHGLCALAKRAREKRLMTSCDGILSARRSNGSFLLTPAALPRAGPEPADLLCLDLGGRTTAGSADPAEAALHRALYLAHPEVRAILHGFPEHASGFSVAGLPLPSRTIPESYLVIRDPASIAYRTSRTDPGEVAQQIGPETPTALIRNDGVLVLGRDLLDAFDRLEVLEATAAAVLSSRLLGELRPLTEDQLGDLREAFFPLGGFGGTRDPEP